MGAIPWAPQLQNGDVAAKALMRDFDGLGHYLQTSAAISLRAFATEFERTFGVSFTISEAFRDLPTQNYFWNLYKSGKGNPAAVPGTSTHGQGLAVDINSWVYGNSSNTDRHRWLVANAPRFGWSWELVGKPSGEPWHFNYVGGWSDWAALDIIPANSIRTDDDEMISQESQAYFDKKFQDLTAATLRSDDTVVYGWDQGGGQGPIAAFGSSWHEGGVGEPARAGKPGRYVFADQAEYETAKIIFDTTLSKGQPAPFLPPFNEVVFLALPNWVLINKLRQTPVDATTGL